jgi:hypothetical protein
VDTFDEDDFAQKTIDIVSAFGLSEIGTPTICLSCDAYSQYYLRF